MSWTIAFSVLKAEELGLHVVDNLKKNYPVIEKPTEEVSTRILDKAPFRK